MKAGSGIFILVLVLAFANGCANHQTMSQVPLTIPLPQSFSSTGDTTAPVKWWHSFKSEQLNEIVNHSFRDNLDLKVAWSRLTQAEAVTRSSRAYRLPSVDGSLGLARRKSVFLQGAAFGARNINSFYLSTYDLSLAASYEVDLWNRLRSQSSAASRDKRAARAELETIALSLSASLVETWFQIIEQQTQLELLNDQLKIGQTFLELLELRLGQGLSSALDVYQQRQQLSSTRALIPQVKSQEQVLIHQLATLLTKIPHKMELDIPNQLPALPPLPKTGFPIAMLDNRPDIRSAMHRVFAADYRVAAAVAARRPSLQLNASNGFSSSSASGLFDNFIWSLGTNILAPIFDAGRRKAEVHRTKAVVEEQLNRYASTVLTAIREVEDALAREKFQQDYIAELDENISLSEATLEEAKARYLNGLSDYLSVLTALVSLQNLQRTRVSAQRQLLSFRISLHRALGGQWTREMTRGEEEL